MGGGGVPILLRCLGREVAPEIQLAGRQEFQHLVAGHDLPSRRPRARGQQLLEHDVFPVHPGQPAIPIDVVNVVPVDPDPMGVGQHCHGISALCPRTDEVNQTKTVVRPLVMPPIKLSPGSTQRLLHHGAVDPRLFLELGEIARGLFWLKTSDRGERHGAAHDRCRSVRCVERLPEGIERETVSEPTATPYATRRKRARHRLFQTRSSHQNSKARISRIFLAFVLLSRRNLGLLRCVFSVLGFIQLRG